MLKNMIILFLLAQMFAFCVKKQVPPPIPPPPPKTPMVKFMFVNRIGFRNDSTRHGINDTVFQGPCLDLKYYNIKTNKSNLVAICYNRNFPANNNPLTDSILLREYEVSPGCEYTYEIEMVWRKTNLAATKVVKYNIKNYPDVDTFLFARDTTIKFIWPDDTISGNYIKTYQWP